MIDNILFASSTGVSLLTSKMKIGILFDDDTCPICGNKMELDNVYLSGKELPVRYVCRNCTFVCPISHDTKNNTMKPVYDTSVRNFFNNFGEDINSRRRNIIFNIKY